MRIVVGTALAMALAFAAMPASAGDAKLDQLEIKNAWARATPPKAAAGGAFMTITNTGAADDHLMEAKSDVAKSVELHMHIEDNGVMKMRPVQSIGVRAGQTVTMEPGGLHVMFIGLNKPLTQGETIQVTLVFEKAGEVKVPVDVKAVGAPAPAAMMHDPASHMQHMADPQMQQMHQQHMADPNHATMHNQMMGK
ncbi:MAG: copper chaperone PCu(A)C [Solirubrobacterales bacterium]